MRRPSPVPILLASLLAWGAPSGARAGDEDAPAKEEPFELLHATEDGFLEIWADHEVDAARCKAIAARVLKAFDFVATRSGWQDPAPLRAKPLRFRLLGGKLKVLGYAKGPDLMVMKDAYLDDPLSEGTLAHELTHVQDFRQLKGARLPSFLLEGRALTNGHAYRMSLGQGPNVYDRQMAGSALRFTASRAATLLDDDAGRGWDNQAIGTVLVEFMRTRWNGAGVPRIEPRLSRMIERMAEGLALEKAFEKEFETTVDALGEAFGKHLADTQDDPRARLKGTIWESIEPSDGVDEEDDGA